MDPAWPIFQWFLWASAIGFWWIIISVVVAAIVIRFINRGREN
jgi:predicted PurR-regulated permease PerM